MSEEENKAVDYLKNDVVYWLDKGKDFVVIDIGENEKLHSILNLIDKQQKEIEEKATILLAGAEKVKQLEKEIEYQKELYEKLFNGYNERVKEIENSISKDKIREKINQINDEYSMLLADKSLSLEQQNMIAHRHEAMQEVLEELLEEK